MPPFIPIFAQDGDDVGKLIGGVIVVVIWLFSAVASALGKRQQDKQRRSRQAETRGPAELQREVREREAAMGRMQGPSAPPKPQAPPPLPRPPQRRPMPQTSGPIPSPVIRREMPQPRRPKPAPPPREVVPVQAPRPRPPAGTRLATTPAAAPPPTARAAGTVELAQGLRAGLTPRALRRQIVLMEILQPPIALRQQP